MQIPWRRAGAAYGTAGRITVLTLAAAVLVAAVVLPVIGIAGVAVRDTANTFNTLDVGTLGSPPTYSVIYAADGKALTYLYPNDIYRDPVTFDQISPDMRDAIISIEDDGFYKQGALDPRGTLRAIVSDGGGGQLQGASTLAQQYVKNVKELQAQTPAELHDATYPDLQRKIQQLRLAADVEHELTPQQLLADYLNVAYFDNQAWGIQVAAETYFDESAAKLTLPQAALLAGIVQSPSQYNPVANPAAAATRRNEVLTRMWQLHYVTKAAALAAEHSSIKLHRSYSGQRAGCAAPSVAKEAFFCTYVEHVLKLDYPAVWQQINTTGGLSIYTTLSLKDQQAANEAVSYVEPATNSGINPGHNADTEVLVQPGTGDIRALAEDRSYGSGWGATTIDYAVDTQYGGSFSGVQTGSSSKIFTLIAALKAGYPFGHAIKIMNPDTVGPFYSCKGVYVAPFKFNNAEKPFVGQEIWQLAEATVQSVNTYFANLEMQVGLCQVVKTAMSMGITRVDGTNLLKPDPRLNQPPADEVSSFTLGSVPVSPLSMAAAYASVASLGVYCSPQAITRIVNTVTHKDLPVLSAGCHRVMSQGVADAANYILSQVLVNGTAAGRGIPGRYDAAKTGTANGGYYAAFAGYTRTLVGYVSVFNPTAPTSYGAMIGENSCYQDLTGLSCPGQMYGDNAPGATWEYTFLRAALGPNLSFPEPPGEFFSEGNGLAGPETVVVKKSGKGGGSGGGKNPGGGSGGPKPPASPGH